MSNKNYNTKRAPAKKKRTAQQSVANEWALSSLYYKNENASEIERDIKATENAHARFRNTYKDGRWKSSIDGIIQATKAYLSLIDTPGYSPLYYLMYRRELNASDTAVEKRINLLEKRLTTAANQVLFFELALAALPKRMQSRLLKSEAAKPYRYFFTSVFEYAPYQLSEPEERILNLKARTSRDMWVSATEKILNKQTIRFEGKEVPVNGALMQFENLPQAKGRAMYNKLVPVLKRVGEIAESELAALVLDKQTDDELRGFQQPYSSTTRAFDSNDHTLRNLVTAVTDVGYAQSRRFFRLKKAYAGRELSYIDRNLPVGRIEKIPFLKAHEIVREVFYDCNPLYGEMYDRMFQNGHIDVWPKKGKGGGAFCSSGVRQPTMVMLNHADTLDSLRTIAHEMGHAVHAERSKTQPVWYQGHSTLTAETASTFFESLALETLLSRAKGKEKLTLLHNLITDKLMTMVLCIARFNFELEMHETIRREGGMAAREMASGLARHFKKTVGPAVQVTDADGWIVVAKPHYRMNFYQYSYSFGEIGSSIMRSRYTADPNYIEAVDRFLSSGCSDSVESLFKDIGIDMSSIATFHEGLALLQRDIDTFEKLTRALRAK